LKMDRPLFHGKLVYLAAHDPERDAEIESHWTHDPDLTHLVSSSPIQPLSAEQIKKRYKDAQKNKDSSTYSFAVRTCAEDRLVGFVRLHHIEWNQGTAWLKLAIAEKSDQGKGYGKEALNLILRYAFDELNLRRISSSLLDYNQKGLDLLVKAGFILEVRQREMHYSFGRYCDRLLLGLLREDWLEIRQ